MKILGLAAAALAIAVLPVSAARADPMEDVCHARAAKGSGYSGPRNGLTKQVGNTTFRLSGSVALGTSRSSGVPGSNRSQAFAGAEASEKREAKAKDKYTRIYNDCIRTR